MPVRLPARAPIILTPCPYDPIRPLAGEAASQGDANLFGMLLDLEGQSLRMSGDFMITGDNGAQDAMLDAALEQGTVLGLRVHGRMLGGGGGGNVLLFADKSNPELFAKWESATTSSYGTFLPAIRTFQPHFFPHFLLLWGTFRSQVCFIPQKTS